MDPAHQPHRPDPRAGRPDRAQQVRDQGRTVLAAVSPLFRFSQVEVPWALGPPSGRYLLRDSQASLATGEPSHVLVIATLAAPERRRLLSRRRTKADVEVEPEPTPVSTGRATVISVAEPFRDPLVAADWLEAAGEDDLAADLAVLNRALHAFRLVAADPYLGPVGRHQALVARIGYGAGEEVADGLWTQARELLIPQHRQRRARVLAPQARLAALLGSRDRPLVCEELALRARLDLDQGRDREAALQVLIALDAAIAELASDDLAPALAERLEELREYRDPVALAGQAALAGPLDDEERTAAVRALERIEAALRARAVANAGFA